MSLGWASPVSACSAGDAGDTGSIRGSGRSPGGGHSNPLHYSCWENPMDRGAWWITVHGVTKSWIKMKQLSTHTQIQGCVYLFELEFSLDICPGRGVLAHMVT